jgi:hypothetical protein
MNSESTSNIQRTQSGKSTSYKRAHRAKHAVLVKEEQAATTSAKEATLITEEAQPATQIAVEEQPAISEESGRKHGPRFFSSVNKTEKISDQPKADPIAARLTRALRGKSVDGPKEKETSKENKGATSSSRPAAAVSARPKSGFKMKYIWGMMIYLLIADFLGVWIQSWMKAHGLDAIVFTISTFQAYRSTLIFLALLIVILILMARFDLIPRSLGAAMNSSSTTTKSSSSTKTPTFESKEPQPTLKQGVQGDHDELYREYRQNQRYFQKRDRKR